MHCHAGVLQRVQQPGHRLPGDRGVDQQRLGGVADAGPAGLGVQQDALGDVQVGGFVHVDVAVADAGLDRGYLRVADHRVDQARSPARDHHVDQAASLNQVGNGGRGPAADSSWTASAGRSWPTSEPRSTVDQRLVGLRRRRAAAQQHGIAGLERQSEGVDGHVGPALVDHSDHTERDALLPQLQPVGQGVAAQHLTDRVGQPRDLAQTGGDAVDALRVQCQPVEHRGRRAGGPGRVEVFGVGRQDLLGVREDLLGGGVQRPVFGCRRHQGQDAGGDPGAARGVVYLLAQV